MINNLDLCNNMSQSFCCINTLKFYITPKTLPLIIFKLLNVVVFPNGWYRTHNRNIAWVRWFPTENHMILWGWVTRWVFHVEKLLHKWWTFIGKWHLVKEIYPKLTNISGKKISMKINYRYISPYWCVYIYINVPW